MASFNKYSNYNSDAGVTGVVFGAEVPVLEVELNEVQEIQKTFLRDTIKSLIGDGISNIDAISYTNNTLSISDCFFAVNGYLIHCTGLSITAKSGDTVYLQVWEETVDYTSTLKTAGNEQSTDTVPNYIKDNRVGAETSRRKVVKYTLSNTVDSNKENLAIATISDDIILSVKEVNLTNLSDKLSEFIIETESAYASHVSDKVNHITADERTAWNAKASKYEWTATVKGQTWSRIFQARTSIPVIGTSGILNVSFTRAGVVSNATFMIVTSHKNQCKITQIIASGLSPFKIRGVSNTDGLTYIELYDYAGGITADTEQKVYCEFIPLRMNSISTYTEFTDGTTIPSGYTANDALTVSIGSTVASKFVGDLVGNADTATKLATARKIGKASFDGSEDISLADIMGRAITTSSDGHAGHYTKFATIDVSAGGWIGCAGILEFSWIETRRVTGRLHFSFRSLASVASTEISLYWETISDNRYAECVIATKVSDGVYDLYYKPLFDYDTMAITNTNNYKPELLTLYSQQEYVESLENVVFVGKISAMATKLTTQAGTAMSAGSATQPVYFADGVPVACDPQPSASDTVAGIGKLYTGTGTGTDGSMTQKAITTALDDKFGATVSRTANTVLAAPNGSAGGASFRKLVADDIPRLKNSWNFSFPVSGATVDYRTFAKILKSDTNNSGATLLITDGGNYGNTHVGAWIVHITNRGGNPSMHVRALETSSNIVFGFWSNDDYYCFGAKCEKYSAGLFCTVLSSRGSTTIGKINTTSTQPTDWTEVDFLYTPQLSASDTTAGIMKLYSESGENTDGAMTQNAITTELGKYLPLTGGTVTGNLNVYNLLPTSNYNWVGDFNTQFYQGCFEILRSRTFIIMDDSYDNGESSISYSKVEDVMYYSANDVSIPQNDVIGLSISSGSTNNMRLYGQNIRLQSENYISSNVKIAMASDEKVKSFTEDIETDEEKLVKLFDIIKPKSYSYKYVKSDDSLNIGFSAQEIEQAMIDLDIDPEKYGILNIQYGHTVSRGNDFEDGKYYTKFYEISYNDLFNLSLLKTHMMEKEHVERLVALEEKASKLDELEARLSALENK